MILKLVWFCGGCASKGTSNDHFPPVWFFRVFLKYSQWSCITTPFLPCQKQLCSQRLFSVHISLHANELCSPRPSLLWKSKGDSQIIIKNIVWNKCETSGDAAGSWTMGTDPSLSFNFFNKTCLELALIQKTVWSKMICAARHKRI